MKENNNPIYLLGSERSGSNLLRTLIGKHTKISAPIAPHFCDAFGRAFENYLPLNNEKRIILLKDLKKYANHSYNRWEISLDYNKILEAYKLNSFPEFSHAVYQEKALSEGCTTYFSKDNHNHRYATGILKDISNAKFIYLYRDPRDHVASWLRTPLFMHTPYRVVNKWNLEQQEILKLVSFYNVDAFFVKYEDLIEDTQKVMSELLTYLGLDVEEACFSTNSNAEEAKRNPFWKNLDKPIIKENRNKYHDVLKGKGLETVETIAKVSMEKLGYTPTTVQKWSKGNRYAFWISEKIRTRLSKYNHQELKKKDMAIMYDKKRLQSELFSKFAK